MSDLGQGNPINHATLTFSDAAPNLLAEISPVITGVYQPTDYSPEDNLPVPAPLGPYASSLAAFNGSDPNGTWALYVVDDALVDTGTIAGGWSLTLAWEPSELPIQLYPPTLLSDGSAQVTLQAQSGKTYVIEASPDLVTWTPILTNTPGGSLWSFLDHRSTNCASRYYRALSRP
jgi:hypothetical protein